MTLDVGVAADAMDRLRSAYAGVGPTGAFLPERAPADVLPPPLQPYLDACAELTRHYVGPGAGARSWLESILPPLSDGATTAIAALDASGSAALMTAMCALGHTYRWDSLPPDPARFRDARVALPESLDRPWRLLAERLDLPRVGSAWTLHTSNWRSSSIAPGAPYRPEDLSLETLDLAVTWLPEPFANQLRVFSLTFPLTEARGARALAGSIEAIAAAARGDTAEATWALDETASAIDAMREPMSRLLRPPHVLPEDWLEWIQPTMPWSVAGDGDLSGPNGFQIGAIQALDAALGVPAQTIIGAAAPAARRYLPPSHRLLLTALDDAHHLLVAFVASSRSNTLKWRYNESLKALRSWRLVHQKRGGMFLRGSRVDRPRVSTGMGIPWHGDADGSAPGRRTDVGTTDPVDFFERSMAERAAETASAMVSSVGQPGAAAEEEEAFTYLTPSEVGRLLEDCPVVHFGPGDTLLERGRRRQPLYVIHAGTARVELPGNRSFSPRVRPGEVIGELAFVDNQAASASVVAVDDVEASMLSREHVYAFLDRDPDVRARFYQSMAALLARRVRALS